MADAGEKPVAAEPAVQPENKPAEGIVTVPFEGEVVSVMDTGHAVGLVSEDGMELLIHVGVDTVKMNGEGFHMLAKEGQKVKTGEKLLEFDIDKIRKAGFSPVTAVLVTNSDDYKKVKILSRDVKVTDRLLKVD